MADSSSNAHRSDSLVRYTPPQAGRVGFLALAGAASNVLPLPFVPERALTSIRGALVYDVVRRHGLSLDSEARNILAVPRSTDVRRATFWGLTSYMTKRLIRRFGPLWFLSPTLSALEIFAMGHLLDRYLEGYRISHSVRIQAREARHIRTLVDQSVVRALSPRLSPPSVVQTPHHGQETDERDDATRLLDWLLVSSASVPSWLLRRLETAFDEVAAQSQGHTEGE